MESCPLNPENLPDLTIERFAPCELPSPLENSARRIPLSVKYLDPSYIIRSQVANSEDSAFCRKLAQHAAHAVGSRATASGDF